MDTEPPLRYLTASLHVDYLKPTPLGPVLEVRGRVKEVKGRKVVVEEWIVVNGVITVRGEVVAVQVPESLVKELLEKDVKNEEEVKSPACSSNLSRPPSMRDNFLLSRYLLLSSFTSHTTPSSA